MNHQICVYKNLYRDLCVFSISTLITSVYLSGATLEVSSFSAGGMNSTNNVVSNSSLASLGGNNTVGSNTLRSGYPGQLFDIDALTVEIPGGGSPEVADNATLQLAAIANNTDATTYDAVDTATWSSQHASVNSIVAGLLTPNGVAEQTTVTIRADYLGETGTLDIKILDIDTDNFITSPYNFSGDGIPDAWQLANFRPGSGSASPEASPALDGRLNYFKYYFLLSPLRYDLASVITATTVDVGGDDHLAIQFTRVADVPVSFNVEIGFGDDVLVTQNRRNGILHQSIDNGDGTITEIYRDVAPVAGAAFSTVDVGFIAP
ncbi:hypothetical protein [Rubellicoccus peritrichatus]|uniref:Uncharacterized protein n=1 Tax=Rubellicoccus peritrichatus TaxID=3080537 RepID=A0AAQ3LB84_9BACT|nr:hypothetical protein [Puniceicoccus sp. CR14]WOO40303.1 hypothetical protein RZN69_16915 [Puniceicoccus sp. CR14]